MNAAEWTSQLKPGDTVWIGEGERVVDAVGQLRVYLTSGGYISHVDGRLYEVTQYGFLDKGIAWPSKEARDNAEASRALYRRLRRALDMQVSYTGCPAEDIRQAAALLRVELEEEGAEG